MKSLAILLVLAIGISLTFSLVPSAFAVAGSEFSNPTQTNAYASYNIDTNDVQVEWNFDTLPANTVCLLKGDFYYYDDLNDEHTSGVNGVDYDLITGFIPIYYSVVSSNPVNIVNGANTAEVVPCTDGSIRIDIDSVMSNSLNVNNYEDLEIFLSFYVANPDGSLNINDTSRIDEVFVFYTATSIWDADAKAYACGSQVGSTLYIDKSGTGGATVIHGNNGDSCDGADFVYYELQSNEWVDIGMTNSPVLAKGTTATGFHNAPFFSSLILVVEPSSPSKNKGGCGGDCTPPTFYKNQNNIKVVSGGFEFNGNVTDVIDYHTPYDLIIVNTNQTYNLKLKVYENNILEWFQIGFGIPEIGDLLDEAESLTTVYLNFDKTLDRVVTVEKHTLVDIPRVNVTMSDCGYTEQECYILDIDFVYRDQQKNNVIAIEAVDRARNSALHYINDGILIVGESMNVPLEQQTSASKGGAFYPQRAGTVTLTLIDYKNDLWQDKHGYMWSTTQYGPYIINAVPQPIKEADSLSNVMTRTNSNFDDIIIHEKNRAVMIFDASKLVSVLGETFAYEYNKQSQEDYQSELAIKLKIEEDIASKFTKDYSLNQSLYKKNAYNHWNYFGDMSIDEIKQWDVAKRLQLKAELDSQRLLEHQKYNPDYISMADLEQMRQDEMDYQNQLREQMRLLNEMR